MNVLIIYHRVDFDGLFSGAITKKYFTEVEGITPQLLGWNYGDALPEKSYILSFDKIVLVDISFPPEVMKDLYDSKKAVWIDHHDSAINYSIEGGYDDFPGIRLNGTAACELTWNFFYPGVNIPKIIQYVGCYDVWNKERFDWDNETLPIQYALRAKFELKFGKLYNNLNELIISNKILNYLTSCGKSILEYNKNTWRSWIKSYGFPITVAGQYKGIALISPQFGSAMFESVLSEYDIYVVVQRKSGNVFSMSMYKEPDRLPEFNCADYVIKTFGNGGGHVSACGTTLNLEQFTKLITESEI